MGSLKIKENIETLNKNKLGDFYRVPGLKFDINRLRSDLEKILQKKRI